MNLEVLVVSLKHATGRRNAIQSQLDRLKIPFRFIDAVNGRDIPEDKLTKIQSDQRTFQDYNRNLGPGEIGCSLSHQEIYRQVVGHNLDGAIVLEDDVLLDPCFADFFRALEQLPSLDYGVILLGGGEYREKHVNKNYYSWLKRSRNPTPIPGTHLRVYQIISGHKYAVRTCGYFISQTAAKRLDLFSPHNKTLADDWKAFVTLGVLEKINIIQPYLLKHPIDISDSTIQIDRLSHAESSGKISLIQHVKRICGIYQIKYFTALLAHKIKNYTN